MHKLEPRLASLIDDERVRASTTGLAKMAAEEQPIEVTISHEEDVSPQPGAADERDAALADLESRVQASQAPILAQLDAMGARKDAIVHTLTNAVTARLTPSQIAEISQLDEVKLIRHERLDQVTTMNESVRVIEVVEELEDLGYNGRGVRVAVLDTGVDKNHPALLGKVVDEVDLSGEGIGVPGNHGTHTAGTVASNDAVFRGVAYQADIVNIKVLTAAGFGAPASVIQGLDQAVRRNARVASLSLGWSEPFHGWVCNDADCILCQAADNAAKLGVTVVVAAGNEGNVVATNPAFAGMFNIRHPGAARRVITVAAVDKAKALAGFSSIGPGSARLSPASPIRLTKPDVAGPGVNITSSVLGGGFASLSGTSMATPHVAALAALVLQKNPTAKPMMVKKLLEETAEPLLNAPLEVGYGLVNAYSALMRTLA
jgi:serine protease AprX